MESLAWLAVLVPILGVAVVVVFIVAVIQEGKSEKRSFKQAFFVIVSLVMLGISVGATIGLLNTTFRNYAFPGAKEYQRRFNGPPGLYLTGLTPVEQTDGVKSIGVPQSVPYACTDKCEFTDGDKETLTSWKTSYATWREEDAGNLLFRKDLAVILPFLIVALPLFIIFFRLMQKGAAVELTESKRISPIRSLYFYFIAFAGLLVAVIGAGGTINIGLNALLKTSTTIDNNGSVSEPMRASSDEGAVKSIIACADKCGFTAEDKALANQWLTDSKDFTDRQNASTGKTANDLSIYLPLLLVGIPLFWYHFARIRKETQDTHPTTPTPTPVTS